MPEKRTEPGSAIERLLATHRSDLERYVAKRLDPRLRGRIDASDVVQDVCLEAARRYEHFESRGGIGFLGWLRSLAKDRLIDLRRTHVDRQRRSVHREVRPTGDPDRTAPIARIAADQTSPSQSAMRGERSAQLGAALARLAPSDREIIEWREFQGVTNVEIARRLGISEAAASARYFRALERLGGFLRAGDAP